MSSPLSIAVLITNYNTWEFTHRCVEKIYEYGVDRIEKIVIVDDASTHTCQKEFPSMVEVVRNEKNCGYVASVNIGMQYIREDLVVLLDSDAYPVMNIFETLTQNFVEDPSLGAMSLHLVDEKGQVTGNHERVPNCWGLILGQKIYGKLRGKRKENAPFVCYSCGVVIRREAFFSIDGFDESFDFLDGDIDFFMRLRLKGWRLKISNDLRVFHVGGGSPQSTAKRVLRFYRNRYKFLDKHKLLPTKYILHPILFLRHLAEYILLCSLGIFLYKDREILKDKKKSRKLLLKKVWCGYESIYGRA
ncbi:glycosyltransferase family 2 protein [Candidatus Uabimicrobium amorphum]|uniref:Glycosyl transferase n=1 Tax=Uabimicrobium amorphum TaxID=2596890 RepID=A0A5S9F4R6_UABAM|nr:glycosyltransferase [Candidatus Uabimicrobium amorphum]BBM84879.1 glycosyl transferase [Candidatus Uabimicrobium amorphum]